MEDREWAGDLQDGDSANLVRVAGNPYMQAAEDPLLREVLGKAVEVFRLT